MPEPELTQYLLDRNPWWSGSLSSPGIRREKYLKKIRQYIDTGEITVLNGIRRSGKTTLLLQTIYDRIEQGADPKSILFVNCDEPEVRAMNVPLGTILETYQHNIYGGEGGLLVFDEIQSIPGWEHWIKAWYDRKKYRIMISGSTSSLLNSQLSPAISGRYLKITVHPLDFSEYLLFKGVEVPDDPLKITTKRYELLEHLRNYFEEGGFPAGISLQDKELQREIISGYYDSIIFRDIERMHEIRNPRVLHELIDYLMANIALPYSYAKIAKMLNTDGVTIKEYVSAAEEAFLLYELRSFSYSLRAQNASQKKIYAADLGLRNIVSFRFSADEGRLAENLVYLSLIQNTYRPYFWKGKHEVDFIIQHRDRTLSAVNVCYTDEIPEREFAGLEEFSKTFGEKTGMKILITKNVEKIERDIQCIPLYRWLLLSAKFYLPKH